MLNAHLDGELDPAHALEMEQRLARDPALAAQRDRIEALRAALRERLPRESLPPELAARVQRAIAPRRVPPRPSWTALAATVLLTAGLASGATWQMMQSHTSEFQDAVLSAHIRSLMAPQPTDVASSERHTVKPWFNGRIPEAPRVVDLAALGFPLAGARVDVIGRAPVPTVVYRRRQHVISVVAVADRARADAAPQRTSADGYNLVTWTQRGVTYWAISDLNAKELDEFAAQFRTRD
jgi:anti-sigma factor RsiW